MIINAGCRRFISVDSDTLSGLSEYDLAISYLFSSYINFTYTLKNMHTESNICIGYTRTKIKLYVCMICEMLMLDM